MLVKVKHTSGQILEVDRGTADRLLARSEGKYTELTEPKAEPVEAKRPIKKKKQKNEDTKPTGDSRSTESREDT